MQRLGALQLSAGTDRVTAGQAVFVTLQVFNHEGQPLPGAMVPLYVGSKQVVEMGPTDFVNGMASAQVLFKEPGDQILTAAQGDVISNQVKITVNAPPRPIETVSRVVLSADKDVIEADGWVTFSLIGYTTTALPTPVAAQLYVNGQLIDGGVFIAGLGQSTVKAHFPEPGTFTAKAKVLA